MFEQLKPKPKAKIQGGGGNPRGEKEQTKAPEATSAIEAIEGALAAEELERRREEDAAIFEALNPVEDSQCHCGCFC